MNKKNSREIFDKYNPASDKIRCPYGKASLRDELDMFAKAAVNLYGAISKEDFVYLFNSNSAFHTDVDEIYVLLLPLILREENYGFYKDYLVHYWAFDDFDQADDLIESQTGKPRYFPPLEEFLKYANGFYSDETNWDKLYDFMVNGLEPVKGITSAFLEIKGYLLENKGISQLGPILEKHGIVFDSEKQAQEFMGLAMEAMNGRRLWNHNGHTPTEIQQYMQKKNEKVIAFPVTSLEKIGRNDPCPCGSGKKYKKCCGRHDLQKSAQLEPEEVQLFYESWYGLLAFVNERDNVIKKKIKAEYPNEVSDFLMVKVRDVLWDHPEYIDEYISTAKLPQEKVEILRRWREKHIKGGFLIVEYQEKYAVLVGSDEEGKDCLYGVKGISNSVSNAMRARLPAMVETVLLPFKGKIVYDSYMGSFPVGFMEGALNSLNRIYEKAKEKPIITSLE